MEKVVDLDIGNEAPYFDSTALREILTALAKQHAKDEFALVDRNRDYLREWMPWVDGTRTPEDTKAFIRRSLQQFANSEGFACGIWFRGRHAGTIGVNRINWTLQMAEIGYWIGKPYWGLGHASEAVARAVAYAFGEGGLERLEASCHESHVASRRVLEKNGFRFERLGPEKNPKWGPDDLFAHFSLTR